MKEKRILIDGDIYKSLTLFVSEIKEFQEYSKVNQGRLASEILKRFFQKYYPRDKVFLSKKFFNKRAFLKNLLKKTNSDEELLQSFQKHLKKSPKRQLSRG